MGNALYDTRFNREYLAANGLAAYIPARWGSSEIDKFILEGGRVVVLVVRFRLGRLSKRVGEFYYFSAKDCGGCRHYGSCVSAGEVRKKVYLSECKRLRVVEYKKGYEYSPGD